MTDELQPVIAALQNAPGMAGVTAADCTLTRQGGLTNRVYLAEARGQRLIVRIPGAGTEAYINRAVEVHNARAAHAAGVAPAVLWADAATGVMITRAIDGITTMTPAGFRARDGAVARAGRALAQLHRSGQTFEFRFELFAMIDGYLSVLATKDATLPDGYHDIVAAAQPVKALLAANPVPLAPCHCDPLCENFLDDGQVMWIVDWEYSGMNDPLWDLGDLSVEAQMSAEQDHLLLEAYFGRPASGAEVGRMVIYKAMCDLLWTLWGLIQHADGNTADDFWAYATGRFDRCKTLMRSASWPEHLEAVRDNAT
jgi:thiamine kinase-like enzyme